MYKKWSNIFVHYYVNICIDIIEIFVKIVIAQFELKF